MKKMSAKAGGKATRRASRKEKKKTSKIAASGEVTEQRFKWPFILKLTLVILLLSLFMAAILVLYRVLPDSETGRAVINYPEEWVFNWQVTGVVDRAIDWLIVNGDPIFSAINIAILRGIMNPLEDFFLWLPWWSVILLTGLGAWFTAGKKFAFISLILIGLIAAMGLLDLACETLAIMLTSTIVCIVLGLPMGIIGALSNNFDKIQRPVLDTMQTMPTFVYLIPAVMLFGLGKVPAVIATVIYALPPIIRLTTLGIREVDAQLIEAARSFGATRSQILTGVQLPMALSSILAGLNQTIMMALGMVVIASMIGAGGLGVEIHKAITRLEVGRGFIAGTGIVFMAMILDRVSQGIARRTRVREAQ
jgi:glycine betaine/proline transport system permease protein